MNTKINHRWIVKVWVVLVIVIICQKNKKNLVNSNLMRMIFEYYIRIYYIDIIFIMDEKVNRIRSAKILGNMR
jgi:hypothetical protein